MKKTVGIFRTLPKVLVTQERRAAKRHSKSLDGVATGIYDHFFRRMTESERRLVLDSLPDKKMGRPIK